MVTDTLIRAWTQAKDGLRELAGHKQRTGRTFGVYIELEE